MGRHILILRAWHRAAVTKWPVVRGPASSFFPLSWVLRLTALAAALLSICPQSSIVLSLQVRFFY